MAQTDFTPEERRARRARQQSDYDKRATKAVYLKLNRGTDADILEALEAEPNKQGYVKRLIREDLARRAARE